MGVPFFSLNIHRKEMEDLERMARQLGASQKQIDRAKITALNSVSAGWKKEGLNAVKQSLALKSPAKYYNQSVFVLKASRLRPYIIFRAKGKRSLPLSNYDFTKTPEGKKRRGRKGGPPATARVFMDNPRKALGRDGIKAFTFKSTKSGKRLIGERDGRKIKVLYAPSLVSFLGKPSIRHHLMESTYERFKKRFEHDLNAIMRGFFS